MGIRTRIKQLVVRRQYEFGDKAADELAADGLEEADVLESILKAERIKKTLRSFVQPEEKLYVIESRNYHGTLIYSKGKITKETGEETYYVLISSKRSRRRA